MAKIKSIASFIENLPMDGSVGNCESTLLVTDMASMGGAGSTNGADCVNKSDCAESQNTKNCVNYTGACDYSSNGNGCTSKDIETPPPGGTDSICGPALP